MPKWTKFVSVGAISPSILGIFTFTLLVSNLKAMDATTHFILLVRNAPINYTMRTFTALLTRLNRHAHCTVYRGRQREELRQWSFTIVICRGWDI